MCWTSWPLFLVNELQQIISIYLGNLPSQEGFPSLWIFAWVLTLLFCFTHNCLEFLLKWLECCSYFHHPPSLLSKLKASNGPLFPLYQIKWGLVKHSNSRNMLVLDILIIFFQQILCSDFENFLTMIAMGSPYDVKYLIQVEAKTFWLKEEIRLIGCQPIWFHTSTIGFL